MKKLLAILKHLPTYTALIVILISIFIAYSWIGVEETDVHRLIDSIAMSMDLAVLLFICGLGLYFASEKQVQNTHRVAYIAIAFAIWFLVSALLDGKFALSNLMLDASIDPQLLQQLLSENLLSGLCLLLVATQLALVQRIKQSHWTMHYSIITSAFNISVATAAIVQFSVEPDSIFILSSLGGLPIIMSAALFIFSLGLIGLFLRVWERELTPINLMMFVGIACISASLVFWQVTSSREFQKLANVTTENYKRLELDVQKEIKRYGRLLIKSRGYLASDQSEQTRNNLKAIAPVLLDHVAVESVVIRNSGEFSSTNLNKEKALLFNVLYEGLNQQFPDNLFDNRRHILIKPADNSKRFTRVYLSNLREFENGELYFLMYIKGLRTDSSFYFLTINFNRLIEPVINRYGHLYENVTFAQSKQQLLTLNLNERFANSRKRLFQSNAIVNTGLQLSVVTNPELLKLSTIDSEVLLFSLLFSGTLMALTYQFFSYKRLLIKKAKENLDKDKQLSELIEAKVTVDLATRVSNLGVWSWQIEDDNLVWNENMYQMYEVPPQVAGKDLSYETWANCLHQEDREKTELSLTRALEMGVDWNKEFRLILPGGRIKYILAHATFVKTADGKPIKMIGGNIDITELRNTQNRLVELKDLADKSNTAKSQFLANMSHEIRTPMNGVIGITGLLQQTQLTPLQQEYLQLITNSADSLLRLLNDLLDHSKIEAGMLEIHREPCALDHQIGDVLKGFAPTAHQKMLDLQFFIDPDVPNCIISDPMRLGQIVFNLVGNAIKFTDAGNVTVNVDVKQDDLVLEDNQEFELIIKVSDTGIGIPEDKIEAILEPFAQADTTTTRRFGGTGLGLPIVNQLIKLMSGKLEIQSEVNVGSTFLVTLPVVKGDESLLNDVIVHSHVINKYDFTGINCFVVDDNALNRKWLENMLSSWGCKVELTSSAEQAEQRLLNSDHEFDVMIVDKDMPNVDGFQLLENLASQSIKLPLVIMMLHTNDISGEMERIKSNNIKHYIFKPVKQSEVFNIMAQILDLERPDLKSSERQELPLPSKLLNILVAEDNPINSRLVNDILTYRGHNTTLVFNGLQAVDKFKSEQFDVILMDIQMPEMDGLKATEAIRKLEQHQGLPRTIIVGLTAHALTGDRQICIDAGMDDYLTKPVDSQKLLMLIESFQSHPEVNNMSSVGHPEITAKKQGFQWLDEAAIESVTSGQSAIIQRMLEMTLELLPKETTQIDEYRKANQWTECAELAHKLKGMVGNISGDKLQDDFVTLEQLALDNDASKFDPFWLRLSMKLNVLLEELKTFYEEQKS